MPKGSWWFKTATDRAVEARIERLERFESWVPVVLKRGFSPASMSTEERLERLEMIHATQIADFEKNWLVKQGVPAGIPEQVQLLLVDNTQGKLLIRHKDGSLELISQQELGAQFRQAES